MLTTADRLRADKAVLVVVDVQHDFCSPNGAMAARGHDLSDVGPAVQRMVELIRAARSAGVPVVFVRTTHSEETHSDTWRYRCLTEDAAEVCTEGSSGADLYQVEARPGDIVVTKHRYSAFTNPDFKSAIDTLGRHSLLFTGIATNVCVETSLRDAVCADYLATLVDDCCAAYTRSAHEATLENVRGYFGLVASSHEVMQAWLDAPAATSDSGGRSRPQFEAPQHPTVAGSARSSTSP